MLAASFFLAAVAELQRGRRNIFNSKILPKSEGRDCVCVCSYLRGDQQPFEGIFVVLVTGLALG